MSHPIDQTARDYTAKLDELQEVERQLKGLEPLLKRRDEIQSELAGLRDALAGKPPIAESPSDKPARDNRK
jgi:hypothetical protein